MPKRYFLYTVLITGCVTLAALLTWNSIGTVDPAARVPRAQISFQQTRPELAQPRSPFEYLNFSNLNVDRERLVTGGPPVDGIPSLTNPKRVSIHKVDEEIFSDESRVAQVVIDGEAVAYPINILNFHEIANDNVGSIPVAVTYCPLCDSVLVFDRRVKTKDETSKTLEFGVSGLLLNSNVVMYDRTDKAMWSQGLMKAISGPHAGYQLITMPVQMTTLGEFRKNYSEGEVISTNTGYDRNYSRNVYKERGYFDNDKLIMPIPEMGDEFSPKTLGIGITAGDEKIFVPKSAVKEESPVTIETKQGPVVIAVNDAGLFVKNAPEEVQTMQIFYFAWSAFHPTTTVRGH